MTQNLVVEGTKPATVSWSVRPGVISLSVDGQRVYRWSGDFRRLSSQYREWVKPGQLAIGQHGLPFRISKVELASLVPEFESDAEPGRPPIGPQALVTEPGAAADLESWSIETIGHRGAIHQAAFSNDGKLLATLGEDLTVRVWETATHRLKHALPALLAGDRAFAFSPDNQRLAIAGGDGLRIFDMLASRWCVPRQHQPFTARALAWSPDARRLAAFDGLESRTACKLRLFDATNGNELTLFEAPQIATEWGTAIVWSHDSQRIAVAPTREGAVAIDAASGEMLEVFRNENCLSATWANEISLLVAVQPPERKAIELWRADNRTLLHTLSADDGDIRFQAFSANGDTLVAMGKDGDVFLWDTATGERFVRAPHAPDAIALSSLTRVAVSNDRRWSARFGGRSGEFALLDLGAKERLVYRFEPIGLEQTPVEQSIAWSPDGSELATRSFGDQVVLWDARTFAERATLTSPFDSVTHICWASDARVLTVRLEPGRMRVSSDEGLLIDLKSGDEDAVGDGSLQSMLGALSPDGRYLASANRGQIHVYATDDGKLLNSFTAPAKPLSGMAWSHDATKIAVVSNTTDVFDAETGNALQTIQHSGNAVWSPDGRLLLLWQVSPEMFDVYDTFTGQPVVKLETHVPEMSPWSAPSWSPDGTRIAGRGRLWEVRTGKVISRLPHYGTHPASGAPAWSPDSERLAYLTRENTIAVVHAGYCRIEAVLLALDRKRTLAIGPHGHIRGAEGSDLDVVYIVQEKGTVRTLAPKEFADKYGWKNDPSKVTLP